MLIDINVKLWLIANFLLLLLHNITMNNQQIKPGVPKKMSHLTPNSHLRWDTRYITLLFSNVHFSELYHFEIVGEKGHLLQPHKYWLIFKFFVSTHIQNLNNII